MLKKDLTEKVNAIVHKSGKLLENLMKDPAMRKVRIKADKSPITPADIRLNESLTEDLKIFGYPIVSEESLPENSPSPETPYFLVDPLDGTRHFARGEPEFSICVGLIVDGKPHYGAIYDPIDSRLLWAQKRLGAFCEDATGRIRIFPNNRKPSKPLSVYCGDLYRNPKAQSLIEKLNIGKILEKGSALKFHDIALGRVDLYIRFGPTKEWDIAAAQVLMEESGCLLYEMKTLKRMTYGKPDYLNSGVIACHKDTMPQVIHSIESIFKTKEDLEQ